MYPSIEIGRLHLSSYGLLHILGTLVAGMLLFYLLMLVGISAGKIRKVFLSLGVSGFIGASVPGLASAFFHGNPVWGGLSSLGFLLGIALGTLLSAHFLSIEPGILIDRGVVVTPLWLGIGRIGCALAGCCYGKPTEGGLAFMLPDIHGGSCLRYPTQLLSASADFLLFAILFVLLIWQGRKSPAGEVIGGRLVWVFFAGFAVKRLLLDGLRGDLAPLYAGLSLNQLLAIAYLVLLLPVVLVIHARKA